jgi:uncharacterized protein (DUF885 family)
MKKLVWIFVAVLIVPVSAAAGADNCGKFAASVKQGSESKKLKSFLDTQWKYFMTESPEWATFVGHPGMDDRWSDVSMAAIERHRKEGLCQKAALTKVKRAALSIEDRVTYDLALRRIEIGLEADKFDGDYMPINHMDGFHIDSAQVLSATPQTLKGYEDRIKRLETYPVLAEQNITLMREGVKRKVMPVKAFMFKISEQLKDLMPSKVEDSPLFESFKEMNALVPTEHQARLRAKAAEVIKGKVYPAIAKFKEFFDKEYAPHGREAIAWTDMPNGKDWYAYKVKYYTTTKMTPDELHELGVKEVASLTAEMEKVKAEVKFKGDLKAFNKFLLTDKRFQYTNKEDILTGYRDIAKRLDAELPRLFKTLPRLPYGVREIPEFAAKSSAGAQYMGGSLASGRAGYFEANTYDLPSTLKWDMETLTIHEAVPGHHLQIALAQEIPNLPEFRRHGHFTAYIEGWALYAETLGKDMGFFKDPYNYYGHLGAQMMRAVRLVVDTGMHAKGWSKQQAWDYYRSKFPTSDVDSENEINRYITWPGQALAYKVGQLKIRDVREKAKVALADKFDIREFHDEVLRHGALPMDVLEKTIDEWAARVKKTPASGPSKVSTR